MKVSVLKSLVLALIAGWSLICVVEAPIVEECEDWAGSPPLPVGWSIEYVTLVYDPNAIHQSTLAYKGNYSIRLGGANNSEIGWNLSICLVCDLNFSVKTESRYNNGYRIWFRSFFQNPSGDFIGGASVTWMNASHKPITTDYLNLAANGSLIYKLRSRLVSPPETAKYVKIRILKESFGFINYDSIRFSLAGDINCDGKVDMKDIAIWCRNFGLPIWPPHFREELDLDGNGKIDIKDIGTIAKQFGLTDY